MSIRTLIIGGALTLVRRRPDRARPPPPRRVNAVTAGDARRHQRADRHRRRRAAGGARRSRSAAIASWRSAPRAEIARYVGPVTQVIDCEGAAGHPRLHRGPRPLHGVGEAQLKLNLMNVTSWDEIVAMVAEAVKTAQAGRSGSSAAAGTRRSGRRAPTPNVEGFPTHASLDKVSPNNPVLLTHASGHASFVNGKAMELSGITRTTESPAGGEILKDAERRADRSAARDAPRG